jgi:hypothetical protein
MPPIIIIIIIIIFQTVHFKNRDLAIKKRLLYLDIEDSWLNGKREVLDGVQSNHHL